jgi:uncharacterized MAPEG superfamily protein
MNVVFVYPAVALALVYAPRYMIMIPLLEKGYDNRHPRDQQAKLEGWMRRAVAAHQNGFESFAPFAAAIVMAYVAKASATHVHALAITHLVARALYVVFYIGDVHVARSAVWTVGMLATLGLMILAIVA